MNLFGKKTEIEHDMTEDVDLDVHSEYARLCDDNLDVDFMFDVDKLKENQMKDLSLQIVRDVMDDRDMTNKFGWLPARMKNLIVLSPEHEKAILHHYHHRVGVHSTTTTKAKELITRYYWPKVVLFSST